MNGETRLAAAVRSMLSEISGIPPEHIRDEDRLTEDLGLDSLQGMELLSRLCEDLELDPSLEQAMAITTVREVVAFLLEAETAPEQ